MLANLLRRPEVRREGYTTGISIYDWAKMFAPGATVNYQGNQYQAYKLNQAGNGDVYNINPVVFAAANIRIQLFSEVRFVWQQYKKGKPGDQFTTPELNILEEPWPGHTTRDLLKQAETDVMTSGNSYWVINGQQFQWLDPTKMRVITAVATDELRTGKPIGEELAGYAYWPDNDARNAVPFLPQDICHYKPHPNPQNRFIGLSWLSPCLQDIHTDDIINAHKEATIRNGASLSTVATFDPSISPEEAEQFIDQFTRQHAGPDNAGKTLFLGGGTDVKTVGQTFENMMLQAVQNSGEVRVVIASGVPATMVGISEGLKGSTLNAGNYKEARRRLSDVVMRPLWGEFASAMQSLLGVPGGTRLWYDDEHVAFLREDVQDLATILDTETGALQKLIQSGYDPDAAIAALVKNDLSELVGEHTGLFSVQLQPPANGEIPGGNAEMPAMPPMNGNGSKPPVAIP